MPPWVVFALVIGVLGVRVVHAARKMWTPTCRHGINQAEFCTLCCDEVLHR